MRLRFWGSILVGVHAKTVRVFEQPRCIVLAVFRDLFDRFVRRSPYGDRLEPRGLGFRILGAY